MIKNILKKLILVLLMLFSLLMQAQDPVTNIDLNTDESGKLHCTRIYKINTRVSI